MALLLKDLKDLEPLQNYHIPLPGTTENTYNKGFLKYICNILHSNRKSN